eukprot:TRINITY_DN5961_c0_g1_i1.p1 TRINITY_DN5961_c0_g1~~TRINITY_DN5961_c0_g1_i1.p1  ORF type:complete len:489 (-),score=121.98 TRINITY_DN5961_c0_g1_i1:52-1476(-)
MNNETTSLEGAMSNLSTEEPEEEKPTGVLDAKEIVVEELVEKNATESQRLQARQELTELYRGAATSFEGLNISSELQKGVSAIGWSRPSKIQELTLPIMVPGGNTHKKHIIAQAQSGTGKTGAFSLGLLSRVIISNQYPQVIVLEPTRELATQTHKVIKELSKFTTISVYLSVPKAEIPTNLTSQVIVGTPLTVKTLITKRKLDIKKITVFVLDEADMMLAKEEEYNRFNKNQNQKQNHGEPLAQTALTIRNQLSKDCAIMLFSATYEDDTAAFGTRMVPEEGRASIKLKQEELSIDKISQYVIKCRNYEERFDIVSKLFDYMTVGQTIIFVEKILNAKKLYNKLQQDGHKISILYGKDMDVNIRDKVMNSFREGETKVLITTNVLARGIDVSQVTLVINFDVPMGRGGVPDRGTYLHRIGRSGRYGRSGIAINIASDEVSWRALLDFQSYFSRKINDFPQDLQELDNMLRALL